MVHPCLDAACLALGTHGATCLRSCCFRMMEYVSERGQGHDSRESRRDDGHIHRKSQAHSSRQEGLKCQDGQSLRGDRN
eukprot:4824140-Prymnesium_polylepis.1